MPCAGAARCLPLVVLGFSSVGLLTHASDSCSLVPATTTNFHGAETTLMQEGVQGWADRNFILSNLPGNFHSATYIRGNFAQPAGTVVGINVETPAKVCVIAQVGPLATNRASDFQTSLPNAGFTEVLFNNPFDATKFLIDDTSGNQDGMGIWCIDVQANAPLTLPATVGQAAMGIVVVASCSDVACPAGTGPASNAGALRVADPDCCCSATCSSFGQTCPDGTGLVPNADKVLGNTAEVCCAATCSGFDETTCPAGTRLVPDADAVFGSTADVCCSATCSGFGQTCPEGAGLVPNADEVLGNTAEVCCAATCSGFDETTCPAGKRLVPDADAVFGSTAQVCCLATCAGFDETTCPAGTRLVPDADAVFGSTADVCCSATCSGFGQTCPDGAGLVPNADKVLGNTAEVCCAATCSGFDETTCPAGKRLVPNANAVFGSAVEVCCFSPGLPDCPTEAPEGSMPSSSAAALGLGGNEAVAGVMSKFQRRRGALPPPKSVPWGLLAAFTGVLVAVGFVAWRAGLRGAPAAASASPILGEE